MQNRLVHVNWSKGIIMRLALSADTGYFGVCISCCLAWVLSDVRIPWDLAQKENNSENQKSGTKQPTFDSKISSVKIYFGRIGDKAEQRTVHIHSADFDSIEITLEKIPGRVKTGGIPNGTGLDC